MWFHSFCFFVIMKKHMLAQPSKNLLFSKSSLLIGLILIFLAFVIYCGSFHNSSGCNVHLFLTSQFSLFFIVSLVALFKKNQSLSLLYSVFLFPSLIFLWFQKFAFKIYNPILEAFRQGIIHSQIYNFQLISR